MRTCTLALAVVTACSSTSKPAEQAAPPAETTTTTTSTPAAGGSDDEVAARIASTGPLSEAEFKALHQLRSDAPPAPRGEMIELAGARAYLSLPAGAAAPVPGIVVIHEWWGLNQNIEYWADRLAGLGYAALAVDLYSGQVATTPDQAMTYMKAVDGDAARRILSAAVDFLASDPRVRAPRRAVVGWCFGGGWSLQTGIDHPELDAVVVYYGQPELDPARLGHIKGKLLGIFANRDKGITPDKVNALEQALHQAGVDATIRRYDADHAFANPSSGRYDEPAAAAAWQEMVGFLTRNLGGASPR